MGGKSPYFPPYTLLTTIDPLKKKYKIAPKSGKNNFLRSTLVTLRGSSYSPLYDRGRGREKSQHFGCHNKSSQSIFFGPTFKLCQRRLILPPFPLKTRRPPLPRKTRSPSHPSFQAKNGDLFLTSAQRFSENVKFMISCLSL